MKNSPHHRKHLQHKAIRAANKISLHPKKAKHPLLINHTDLKPLNTKKCINILNLYKKHLEKARLHKSNHQSRGSTPGEIEGTSYTLIEKNPTKMSNHLKASDREKSKRIARKMLKQSRDHYKKAA